MLACRDALGGVEVIHRLRVVADGRPMAAVGFQPMDGLIDVALAVGAHQ